MANVKYNLHKIQSSYNPYLWQVKHFMSNIESPQLYFQPQNHSQPLYAAILYRISGDISYFGNQTPYFTMQQLN
ncbi:hypothetical protein [Vibrio profundum]|uniref:hypothetical protein n=1 Tax=Vibrio profundum TaxID=2910247 RepID=UPI003D0F69F3